MERIGVFLVGARGAVAATAVLGAAAVRRGLAPSTGLVSALPPFRGLELAPLEALVFGGWDPGSRTLPETARELREKSGLFANVIDLLRPDLEEADARVRPGTSLNCGETITRLMGVKQAEDRPLASLLAELVRDLTAFREENRLTRLVVMNVASTEPWTEESPATRDLAGLRRAVRDNRRAEVPASVLYAMAALEAGAAYVNFTPSLGSSCGAIRELALEKGLPHAGRDGKTGETFMKTAIAPALVARNLRILSWEGYNLLGNRDGAVLDDPANARTKIESKDEVLHRIADDPQTHSRVRIDFVPSLDDWKVAWDYVHFEGFLGTRMSLQFTWQGCDSILAAPLVLDLARFAALALRRGESGVMRHLASFFKNPLDCAEQSFAAQFEMLLDYAGGNAPVV